MKMKSTKQMRFTVVYALCFLILMLTTSSVLLYALRQSIKSPSEPEEIYVYLPQEDQETENESTNAPSDEEGERYLVKEYQGRIGIFSEDGRLLEVLDTYVKTLPEADRSLLGEGIWVKTREELNSLIEDYSH